jgi:peptidoglycan/LPS O-acetylase OafA/YrhL
LTPTNRNFGLDLLRAAAIVGVFLGHATRALERMTMGLDLFFVLSGFLVGRIYFRSRKDGSFQLGKFWLSRWWRTLPPYFAALAIYALTYIRLPGGHVNWTYCLFLQNLIGTNGMGFGQSWSLCVEEHFYLLLPFVGFVAVKLFGKRSMLWLLPALFIVPSLLDALFIFAHGGPSNIPRPWNWESATPFASQGLIAGLWLAFLFVEKPNWFTRARNPSIAIALILVPVSFSLPIQRSVWLICTHHGLKAIACAALLRVAYGIHWQPVTKTGQWLAASVRATSISSYSVYLVHTLLNAAALQYTLTWHRGSAKSAFIILGMLLPCIPFYFLFEKPSIVTRDRFMKRITSPIPVA